MQNVNKTGTKKGSIIK